MPDIPIWVLFTAALGAVVAYVLITGFAMPKTFHIKEEQRLAILRKRLQANDESLENIEDE